MCPLFKDTCIKLSSVLLLSDCIVKVAIYTFSGRIHILYIKVAVHSFGGMAWGKLRYFINDMHL